MNHGFKNTISALFTGAILFTTSIGFGANFNNDETVAITPPLTGAGKIIRATVHFIDFAVPGGVTAASPVNVGIALGQDAITAWTGYSAYARFDNADAKTKGIIEARNDAAMGAENDLYFDLNKSYYVWFTVDLAKSKYSVSAQDATTSTVVKIATDYTFRMKPITSVGYVSILHNGDNGDGVILKIDEVTYPTSITAGPIIDTPTAIKSVSVASKFSANIYGDKVIFNQAVKSAKIFDLTGNLVGKSSNVSSMDISQLSQGMHIIKTDVGMLKLVK